MLFIESEFKTRNQHEKKIIYAHRSIATDINNINAKVIFKMVFETLIRNNLEMANLM